MRGGGPVSGVKGHRFSALDRGEGHIHRYTPTCTCGWIGQHRRRVRDAHRLWMARHLPVPTEKPRKPTALADLPEVLR